MNCKHYILLALACYACTPSGQPEKKNGTSSANAVSLVILGIVQDGGSPHIGCRKKCCENLFIHPDTGRKVVSLGIADHINGKNFLFEATPDIAVQLKILQQHSSGMKETPDAIFLTHAHIGHYTGLMYLGREAMNSKNVKVYAMPRMKHFLENNGPWCQLTSLGNITLDSLENDRTIEITSQLKVRPILVPHRDEYSETVGFFIEGPHKKILFIPDINKWEKWNILIEDLIKTVDYVFIDGTFYDAAEINNRNISEIPHPFIAESMARFSKLPASEKGKVYFIHFNHTNPVLDPDSEATKTVLKNGFHIARMNMVFTM